MRQLSRLVVAVLAGMLTLAVAAPAQAAPPPRSSVVPAVGVSAGHGQDNDRLCRQDRRFLVGAHQSNLFEILSSGVALARSGDPEVRRIAQMLIVDHVVLDAQVRAVARRYGVALPATPNRQQLEALATLIAEPAGTFDVTWLRLQERSHVMTLAMIRQELRRGCAADVRALARTAAPIVREHLQMVREALEGR